MTNEELMKPRFEVIADYPNNRFKVGDILMLNEEKWKCVPDNAVGKFVDSSIGMVWVHNPKKYPNLFQELLWWEQRKAEDMPMYVKIDYSTLGIEASIQYWKIKSWEMEQGFGWVDDKEQGVITMKIVKGCMLPSTEEEYLQNKK